MGTSDCHCGGGGGGGAEETLHLVSLYFFDKLGGGGDKSFPTPGSAVQVVLLFGLDLKC